MGAASGSVLLFWIRSVFGNGQSDGEKLWLKMKVVF